MRLATGGEALSNQIRSRRVERRLIILAGLCTTTNYVEMSFGPGCRVLVQVDDGGKDEVLDNYQDCKEARRHAELGQLGFPPFRRQVDYAAVR